MEELSIVKLPIDLREIYKTKYKQARMRIDNAAVAMKYKKIEEEKEKIEKQKEIEKTQREKEKKRIEDEIIKKFKIQRDIILLRSIKNGDEEVPPKKLEEEIAFWQKANKYIRGQSIPDSIKRIVAEVCVKHDKFLLDIESDRKTNDIIPARQELMYRLRTETTWSLPRIGRFLGNRDHTTVLHGVQKFKKQLEKGEVSL